MTTRTLADHTGEVQYTNRAAYTAEVARWCESHGVIDRDGDAAIKRAGAAWLRSDEAVLVHAHPGRPAALRVPAK